MRAALYIRVSTQEQAQEGFSIAAQKERLTAFAASQDWNVVGFYADEGVSAKDTNRPELTRMLDDISKGYIDVVLVYKLDRLTRSVLDLYELMKSFEKYNVKFRSVTEVYDTTTAMGKLFVTIVAALAQWERENLAERVSMGMEQMVREGKWKGSTAPYGYVYRDGKLQLVPEEAAVVKKAVQLYLSGFSDRRIAEYLNQNGYKQYARGEHFAQNTIHHILQNPIHIGKLHWNVHRNKERYFTVDVEIEHILDEATFEQVQQLREIRSKAHPRAAASDYIFSGTLRCYRCGAALKGVGKVQNGRKYKSYLCIKQTVGECDLPMISEIKLEKEFLLHLQNIQIDLSNLPEPTKTTDSTEQEKKRIESELEKIKKRRKKWQIAWADDAISDEELHELMNEDRQLEQNLKAELNQMDKVSDTAELMKAILNIGRSWKQFEDIEKKTAVQILCEKIVIDVYKSSTIKNTLEIKDIQFK